MRLFNTNPVDNGGRRNFRTFPKPSKTAIAGGVKYPLL